MKREVILSLLIILILQSCSPKIKTNLTNASFKPIKTESEIFILKLNDSLPVKSNFVGEIKIGDTGFSSDCGYSKVIDEAKNTAKKAGANIVRITEIKEPNFGSTCYRIKANLYRNLDQEVITNLSNSIQIENKSRLPIDADYAIVYFYRPPNYVGSLIGYDIRVDDNTVIGRVRNGKKFEYKITKFGKYEFWGKTESKTSVIIDVKRGQEYFVRCGLNMGIAVGRPEMYLISNETGISEYESIK